MKTTVADSKGRVTLGSENAGRQFVVVPTEGGFRLEAVKTVVVPEEEAWLWENPESLALVLQGIEESRNGKVVYMDSLEEFADVDLGG